MSRSHTIRACIEDTLALIADREAQLRYQAEVPCVEVSMELFLQWEDCYRPHAEALAEAFEAEELATLQVFHQVFTTVRDTVMATGVPPIGRFVETTAHKRLSGAAHVARGLLRRALQAA